MLPPIQERIGREFAAVLVRDVTINRLHECDRASIALTIRAALTEQCQNW
jgi:hypothetical protein